MGVTVGQSSGTAPKSGAPVPSSAGPGTADTRIVELLIWPRNLLATAGIFLGFWFIGTGDAAEAVKWVCLLAVGGVGVVAYCSHVIFARADARRLGFGDRPTGFQYEVGFFNIAVALAAILAVAFDWGPKAQAALCIVYAAYFLQCGGLFFSRVRNEENGSRFVKNVVIFLVMGGLILFFGIAALA